MVDNHRQQQHPTSLTTLPAELQIEMTGHLL
jgi:hypothetical protein